MMVPENLSTRSAIPETRIDSNDAIKAEPTGQADTAAGETEDPLLDTKTTSSQHNIPTPHLAKGKPGHDSNPEQAVANVVLTTSSESIVSERVNGGDELKLRDSSKYMSGMNAMDYQLDSTHSVHKLVSVKGGDGHSIRMSQHAVQITDRSETDHSPPQQGTKNIQSPPLSATFHDSAPNVIDFQQHGAPPDDNDYKDDEMPMKYQRRRTESSHLSYMSSDDSQESLRDLLFRAMQNSSVDEYKKFIPDRQLSRPINKDTVTIELERCKHSLRKRLQIWRPLAHTRAIRREARLICGERNRSCPTPDNEANSQKRNENQNMRMEFRKIFSILLLIDRPHKIKAFIDSRVCDSGLPLVKVSRDSSKLARVNEPNVPLRCFRKWRDSTIARFEERQWTLLAPIFKRLEGGGLAEGLYKIHHWETLSGSRLLKQESFPRVASKDLRGLILSARSASTETIKKLFGRHGDIKPENIPWLSDGKRGILKITDFGIAHFSTRDSVLAQSRPWVANSPSYRAPESDLPECKLSPPWDIWTLGCAYLEFVTWFFGGWAAIVEFANRRLAADFKYSNILDDIFFTIEESGTCKAKAKGSVTEMMDELRSDNNCTEFFRDFLEIIQKDMLVVEAIYC
ncbi:hypothetical protein CC78DRAFT_581702 [Lojkania enalia]|uniref:Protein kinase domain-containing protein n=1 Tax=Lojkania enalia TaxID=147567 RepID=A0A9P4N2C5_9PLEO|nr:hypothetical protein CC78DRAFT_581702 [Didymosphaeria enalia]